VAVETSGCAADRDDMLRYSFIASIAALAAAFAALFRR
jgi:hypothetical protein